MGVVSKEEYIKKHGSDAYSRLSSPSRSWRDDFTSDWREMRANIDTAVAEGRQRNIDITAPTKFQENWRTAGNFLGTSSSILYEMLKAPFKSFMSQKQEEDLLESVGSGVQKTGEMAEKVGDAALATGKLFLTKNAEENIGRSFDELVRRGGLVDDPNESYWQNFKKKHPEAAQDIAAAAQIGEFALDAAGIPILSKAEKVASKTARAGIDAAQTAKTASKKAVNTSGGALQDAGEFALRQATGLDPDTVKTILTNPEAYEQAIRRGFDKSTVANNIKKLVDDLRKSATDAGSAYKGIRELTDSVNVPKGWLANQVQKFGYRIEDGVVFATRGAKSRAPSDVNALQKLVDDWADAATLTPDEFLNLRSDLANLSKYERVAGKSAEIEAMAKVIRRQLNEELRPKIKGLKELDLENTALRKELRDLDRKLFDREGNLRDTDISKIFNAANKGKQELLPLLKRVDPEIEAKIRLAKAIANVEDAMGNKVGMYIRGGVGGAAVFANPIAGVLLFMMANPKTFVRFLLWTGKKYPSLVDDLVSASKKVKKGTPLNAKEEDAVKVAISQPKQAVDEFVGSDKEMMAAMAGVQIDEEGNLSFNPLAGALGIGAMKGANRIQIFKGVKASTKGRNLSTEATKALKKKGADPNAVALLQQWQKSPNKYSRTEVAAAINAINKGDNSAYKAATVGKQPVVNPSKKKDPTKGIRRLKTTGQYVGAPTGVNSPQKLSALVRRLEKKFEKGESSAKWYKESAEHLIKTLGSKKEAVNFAKLLAIYSPNTSTQINYRRAAMAYQRYKEGKQIVGGGMKNMDKMANDVLYKGMPIRGEKIGAFANNLIKYIDPKSADLAAVTNDLWMMRAFGYLKKNSGMATKQHEFMRKVTQKIAKKYGVEPDEAQAAIWVAERNGLETASQISRGDGSFDKVAQDLVAQVSWEAAPSKTSGLFPELFKAPWGQRLAYHAKIEAAFYDDNGRNMIFDMLGIPQRKAMRAPGVFEGEVSPGTQFIVEVPMKKGDPYKIDEIAYEKLQTAAAIMGKLTFQDSVAFGKAIPAKRVGDANAALVDIGRPITTKEAIAMDAALTKTGVPYGLVPEQGGVKVLIFDDSLPVKEWRGIITDTVKKTLPDADAKVGLYVNDGELIDKLSNDYGQNYLGAIKARPQDIQRGRDVLKTIERRIEEVIQDTKQQYGWTDGRAKANPWNETSFDKLTKEGTSQKIPQKVNKVLNNIGFGLSAKSDPVRLIGTKKLASKRNYKEKSELMLFGRKPVARVYGNDLPLTPFEVEVFKNNRLLLRNGYHETFRRNRMTGEITSRKKGSQPAAFFVMKHPIYERPYINMLAGEPRKRSTKDGKTVARAIQEFFHETGHAIDHLADDSASLTVKHIDKMKSEIKPLARERFERELAPTIKAYNLKPEHVDMLYNNEKVFLRDTMPEKFPPESRAHISGMRAHRMYVEEPTEVFAESYSMYRNNPSYLKKLSPKMYKFIDDVVNKKI